VKAEQTVQSSTQICGHKPRRTFSLWKGSCCSEAMQQLLLCSPVPLYYTFTGQFACVKRPEVVYVFSSL